MKSSDILSKIKEVIVGKSFEDLSDISKSLKKLSGVSTLKSAATFSELLRSMINPKDPDNVSSNELETLLQDFGANLQGITVENDRLQRYRTYESVVEKIPYLKRGLRVFTQSILSPDDIDKVSFNIKIEETVNISKETVNSEVQRILKTYEIEDHAYDIVYSALKKGDYFVEIVNANDVLKSHGLLTESTIADKKVKVILEDTTSNEVKGKTEDTNDIMLMFHDPEHVVRIGDKFCFGYLVFPKIQESQNGQIKIQDINKGNIKTIVDKILSKVKANTKDIINTREDLKQVIARLVLMSETDNLTITARFVPPENMVHFTPFKSEFKPYGTSLFYGQEFLAKIMIAQQSALMVQRLMNAVEKRLIKIELGVSRDAKRYLQEFKETLRRKKYTVDNLGNIDEIPSNIATFEDIYLPVMNGREMVNIDNLPPRGDIGTHVEDLKHMRDTLVAGLEIPPAFLGLEENVESKAMLTQENIIFAMTVVNYQKQFSKAFTELVRKLMSKTSKVNPMTFTILLNPPRMILASIKAEYFGTVVDIIEKLSTLGIPKEYLIEKYLPEIDMNEIKEYIVRSNLEKATGKKDQNTSTMGAWQ